jgi:aspartyl-tRNA(Asn)/glutamyl-tRNA(Gln) amidotransferase subunit A
MTTLTGRSALQLAAILQAGLAGAEAVTEAALAAIDAANEPGLFTLKTPDRARAEAKAGAARIRNGRPRSLLDGVPIAWKDLFDLEGVVTTAGSRVLAEEKPASVDAPVVERLKAAGMVTVGRVGMTEFAFSGLGLNPHYGTPRNPHSRSEPRIPGGSSSGSGVAVARGIVPVSIGTDTGGSVRIPAAFNGIVGYKSTYGRYPMAGVYPLSQTLDSLGVLCRSVADAIVVDAAMRGALAPDLRRTAPQNVTLVVPTNVVFDKAEPEVVARFDQALDRVARLGTRIEQRAIPAFDAVLELGARHGALVTAEAYALHAQRLAGPGAERMDQRVATRMRGGEKISLADFIALREARGRLMAEFNSRFAPGTMLAFPTVPHVAPAIRPLETDDELYVRTNALTLRNTMLGNFLGLCGVSIPCGTGADDLPVGFLLSGLGNTDLDVLAFALAIEDLVRG